MAEYIEREAAIRALLNDAPEQVGYSRENAADCIRYMDAADVAPVRHGYWRPILHKDGKTDYECSCCLGIIMDVPDDDEHDLCAWRSMCGAKMDGGLNMTHEDFKTCLEELDGQGAKTLAEKNARYSSSGDALHNFKMGAEVMGGTPAQACWGYMTKHLVALRDMIQRNDFSNRDDLCEKCQDIINYVRFIWALGNEAESNKYSVYNGVEPYGCYDCAFCENDDNKTPCKDCKGTAIPGTEEYKNRPYYFQWPKDEK